jgi:hypothetical protein
MIHEIRGNFSLEFVAQKAGGARNVHREEAAEKTILRSLCKNTFSHSLSPDSAYPVRAIMSGSTSCGRGPNCEADVMGLFRTYRPLFEEWELG